MANFDYKYVAPRAVLSDSAEAQATYAAVKVVGGYNPSTKQFSPLKLDDERIIPADNADLLIGWPILETLAAALEAGIVDEEMWPTQLFANRDSYQSFVEILREYEMGFKLVDPWWSALRVLAGGQDEDEGFSTAADLADRFDEVLDELPEQWQHKA